MASAGATSSSTTAFTGAGASGSRSTSTEWRSGYSRGATRTTPTARASTGRLARPPASVAPLVTTASVALARAPSDFAAVPASSIQRRTGSSRSTSAAATSPTSTTADARVELGRGQRGRRSRRRRLAAAARRRCSSPRPSPPTTSQTPVAWPTGIRAASVHAGSQNQSATSAIRASAGVSGTAATTASAARTAGAATMPVPGSIQWRWRWNGYVGRRSRRRSASGEAVEVDRHPGDPLPGERGQRVRRVGCRVVRVAQGGDRGDGSDRLAAGVRRQRLARDRARW